MLRGTRKAATAVKAGFNVEMLGRVSSRETNLLQIIGPDLNNYWHAHDHQRDIEFDGYVSDGKIDTFLAVLAHALNDLQIELARHVLELHRLARGRRIIADQVTGAHHRGHAEGHLR